MTISVLQRVVFCQKEVTVFVAQEGPYKNNVVNVPQECHLCQGEESLLKPGFPEVCNGEVFCSRAGSPRKEM